MSIRQVFQKRFLTYHRQVRWLCSSGYGNRISPLLTLPCISHTRAVSYKFSKTNVWYGQQKCWFSSQALVDHPTEGIVDVPLAQTGEGIAECELLKWFVQEGDQVEEFQPLCEVQSDKATIEITSRYNGKVSQILHGSGDIVKVGETLLRMIIEDASLPAITDDNTTGNVEGSECSTGGFDSQSSQLKETKGVALCTPAVRALAKQYGLNVNDVFGTGKDGRVLREDVLNYAANKGIVEEKLTPPNGSEDDSQVQMSRWEDKKVPLSKPAACHLCRGYQRAMVKSMTLAAKVPHFHFVEEINCNALVELKASFQAQNSDPNVKFTFMPLLVKSLSMALTKYPTVNSCFSEEHFEVTVKGSHNIGIAMATPHGLVVPNIKNVQSLSILEVTMELARLQKLALANKLSPQDISGGSITLSNIGAIGGKFGSPLINVPEVSIIALGRIQKIPQFAEDGSIYPASIMTVNIAADHRVLDGATVALFCNEWKLYLEKPELLMLHLK
ncbi:hypothetical protein Leryth_024497 [Lithospermum erythrorhizon]|nr:hypothetical protein Leryth_024497 [Lithospermum erythrorhizon]